MKTYKLENNLRAYQVLQLDTVQVVKQLDRPDLLTCVMNMSASKESFLSEWGTVQSTFAPVPDSPEAVKIPDISIWKGTILVFSGRAHAYFKLMLEPFGEFLPIDVEGYDFYLFHIMTEGEVDLSSSSRENDKFGEPRTVTALKFDEDDMEDKLLFKSEYEFYLSPFCNQKFKNLYEEYDLEGLIFEEDLASPGWR